jgi:hypothetical protein
MHVYSPDGADFRTVPLTQLSFGGRAPLGSLGSSALYYDIDIDPVERLLVEGIYGVITLETEYYWGDLSNGDRHSVESVPIDWAFRSEGATGSIPFSSRPIAAVHDDGAVVTDGRSFEIRRYDVPGRLSAVFRIDTPDRPITAALTRGLDIPRGLTLPESLPAFASLLADPMGPIWAEVYEPDVAASKSWVIFSREGRALGTVSTPPGLDVQAIGKEHILGIWTGPLGVQEVRRHSLVRTFGRRHQSEIVRYRIAPSTGSPNSQLIDTHRSRPGP